MGDAYVAELVDFISKEVIGQKAPEVDAHLRYFV